MTTLQILHLPSGRLLSYATYGSASGTPLLFLHGFPSSRLEASALSSLAALKNIHLIAPDRPGFGHSSFRPAVSIADTDYPADIAALADHLQLRHFLVLAGSGGAPFALALATGAGKKALGSGRISALGVLAGAPPWGAGRGQMPWFSRGTAWAAENVPGVLGAVAGAVVGVVRWLAGRSVVEGWIEGVLKGVVKKERERRKKEKIDKEEEREGLLSAAHVSDAPEPLPEASAEPEPSLAQRRQRVLAMLFEPFAQGLAGFVQEARLLSRDWGFRFEDVTQNRVLLWHGAKDANAPLPMIRWMVARLPRAELKVYEDDTHFTMHRHLEEVVDQLLAEGGKGGKEE